MTTDELSVARDELMLIFLLTAFGVASGVLIPEPTKDHIFLFVDSVVERGDSSWEVVVKQPVKEVYNPLLKEDKLRDVRWDNSAGCFAVGCHSLDAFVAVPNCPF